MLEEEVVDNKSVDWNMRIIHSAVSFVMCVCVCVFCITNLSHHIFLSYSHSTQPYKQYNTIQSIVITTQVDATAAISQILQSPDNSLQLRNITSSSHACYASFTNGHSMGTLLDPLTGLSMNTTNGYSENAYLLPNDGLIMSSGSPNDFCINDSDQQTTQWKNNTRYVCGRSYGHHRTTQRDLWIDFVLVHMIVLNLLGSSTHSFSLDYFCNSGWVAVGDDDLNGIAQKNNPNAVTYDACIIEFGKC